MTAEDRFKWMLANALEQNCRLAADLEKAQARIAELEQPPPRKPAPKTSPARATRR